MRYRSSLVDRDVEVLCTNELIVLHLLGVFMFTFFLLGVRMRQLRQRPKEKEG